MSTDTADDTAAHGLRAVCGERSHHVEKRFRFGTHRAVEPEATLDRIRPLAERAGVTRLADVTGLDRVGIPVVFSVRPNSASLAVDGGKGLTPVAAAVSAAAESIERHRADTAVLDSFRETPASLVDAGAAPPHEHLALQRAAVFRADQPDEFVWTTRLDTGTPLAMPASLVAVQPSRRQDNLLHYQMGSNGLSAGNELVEAICAGLYEVIERDAVSCWRHAARTGTKQLQRVDPATVPHAIVLELLARFDGADVDAVLFDCTVDTLVPTYMAYAIDRTERHVGLARGYGTHLDPAIAMTRALTEAAQSRVSLIAGTRDDRYVSDLREIRAGDVDSRVQVLRDGPTRVAGDRWADETVGSFDEEIAILLSRLKAAAVQHVGVLDLTDDDVGFPVVRLYAPELEGYMAGHYQPGRRARRFAAQP